MNHSTRIHMSLRRWAAMVLAGVVILVAAAFATGRVGYVVTHGVSMQPTYHAGELVVIEPAGSYHIGDIVAYHGGPNGTTEILHRIIGGNANGFVIKGDNNQSTDLTHPRADQIIGKAVAHIPQIGGLISSPITHALVLLALLGLIIIFIKKPAPKPGAAYGSRRESDQSTTVWKSLLALDVILLAAIGLTFGLASSAATPSAAPPTQTAMLSYQAAVPRSDTYPTGRISTGDPVFVNLLHTLGVTFHYSTDAPTATINGTVRLDAAVSTPSGWHTTLPMVAPTALVGGGATVTATLDLASIQTLETAVAKATGVGAGAIDIAVTASTSVAVGSAQPAHSRFQLPLQLTPQELTLAGSKVSPSPHGPAVVSTSALTPAAPSPAHKSNSSSHWIRLALIILLLLAIAATAVVWPTRADPNRR